MTDPLPVIDMPDPETFVHEFITPAQPVVVRGLDYDPDGWTPDELRARTGHLTALIYGSLFDLDDIATVGDYLDDWFADADGHRADPDDGDVPYVRWYNKLRDVEAAWGDEALAVMSDTWRAPSCLPAAGMVVPVSGAGAGTNPVTDRFPYRGLLVAASGARTRLHRDPFGTDAVVAQFHGIKEAVLYHPDRTQELRLGADSTSFGGFLDVRGTGPDQLLAPPDYRGLVGPGEMIYIPRRWLHDVLVVDDSLSVTWNFVHEAGSRELGRYLRAEAEGDSELEILRYFTSMAGLGAVSPSDLATALIGG